MLAYFMSLSLVQQPRSSLFYPCCGNDLLTPLEYADRLDAFWFVDANMMPEPPHTFGNWTRASADEHELANCVDEWSSPCISYLYRNGRTGREVELNCVRGRGVTTMKRHIPTIGVFFYRGDSCGESGSGTWWLERKLFNQVLERLVEGGLIVTDGSNTSGERPWGRSLKEFHNNDMIEPEEAARRARAFCVYGKDFECVGAHDRRYGPTLIWQHKIP